MVRIATYVFIDLETTGLPKFEYNKTRITELSMVVVSRRHVLDTTPGAAPRVVDKLTMCFNPGRMIHPESTKTSGLCNDLLEHQTDFNIHVFNIINGFLQCHEQPVCLVAQNGHAFDFPILKNHFDKLGVALSDDILCADSLHAFYDIFKESKPMSNSNKTNVVDNISSGLQCNESCADSKNNEQTPVKTEDKSVTISTEGITNGSEIQLETAIIDAFLQDEVEELSAQAKIQQQNEKTPHQKPKKSEPINRHARCKRKIYWGNDDKPAVPFKLKNIYERILGRPAIEAHRAENDCIMTMETAVATVKQFVAWVDMDEHHCKFNDVEPMTVGVPLQ